MRWGCPKSNECSAHCGGFDKLNHRNATLLDSFDWILIFINQADFSFAPPKIIFILFAHHIEKYVNYKSQNPYIKICYTPFLC